jgi:hypothetical protein
MRLRLPLFLEETMKQSCLGIIVAIGLTLPAFGQASLKEQLIGAWTLVSCTDPNFAPCAGNNGIHIIDASGHYTTMMAARGRPKVTVPSGGPAGANRNEPTPEQYKAIAAGLFAQFGTWSFNEATKMITYHPDGALFPNIEGTDWAIATPHISGDELTFTGQNGQPGVFVWRRITK